LPTTNTIRAKNLHLFGRQGVNPFATWYYSPDLNPIEQAFAKLKQLLRTEAPRTVEALWSAVGRLLDRFTSAECANYLTHDGYRHSE
jgi:transposase